MSSSPPVINSQLAPTQDVVTRTKIMEGVLKTVDELDEVRVHLADVQVGEKKETFLLFLPDRAGTGQTRQRVAPAALLWLCLVYTLFNTQ